MLHDINFSHKTPHSPTPRPELVRRPRLIERLNAGLHCKLTLVSSPAGFPKTSLLSEWIEGIERPVAWLFLDEGDNDGARILVHLIVRPFHWQRIESLLERFALQT
jgi:ATP/maltotriose-dependent transcriptional regulator MalT